MPYKRRGYRKRWSKPKKGLKPWQTTWNAETGYLSNVVTNQSEVPRTPPLSPFAGFDEPDLKPALRVLSLFDGPSTALLILDRLGIQVEAYFSSEIDEKCLQLQKFNFGHRVTPLGPVQSLGPRQLSDMGQIDLLIGGSPCTDLSLVNPRRRGLHGAGSTGRLFFNYVKICRYLQSKAVSEGYPFWWLFENTTHMEKKVCEEISRCLQCQPVMICASNFLPVIRRRNFWGNIPQLSQGGLPVCTEPRQLEDVLMPYRNANVQTVPTLTTTLHSQRSGKSKVLPVIEEGKPCPLFITEMESLFGFPPHFTDGPNLSLTDRRTVLGKSFCGPVVQHILLPLQSMFRKSGVINHPYYLRGNPLASTF